MRQPEFNLYSLLWLLWLVAFLVLEIYALVTNAYNTLSENVWRLTGVGQPGGWSFAHFMVAAFCLWLACHFVFGWFR